MARNPDKRCSEQYPPAPRPEDFGIDSNSWWVAEVIPDGFSGAKVAAFKNAYRTWEEAIEEIGNNPKQNQD